MIGLFKGCGDILKLKSIANVEGKLLNIVKGNFLSRMDDEISIHNYPLSRLVY